MKITRSETYYLMGNDMQGELNADTSIKVEPCYTYIAYSVVSFYAFGNA